MITDIDIIKLKKVFATRDELRGVKQDLNAIKETQQGLLTGVDKILGKLDDLKYEYVALKLNDDRQNRQVKHIAEHVRTTLPE